MILFLGLVSERRTLYSRLFQTFIGAPNTVDIVSVLLVIKVCKPCLKYVTRVIQSSTTSGNNSETLIGKNKLFFGGRRAN